MIIGSGSHRYEWVEGWAKVPATIQLGYTHGVAEDAQGNIYVHNASKDSVVVFDAHGNFITSWGAAYAQGAHGMRLNTEADGEYLYLSLTNQALVVKTDLNGREIWRIGTPDLPEIYDENRKFSPTESTVAPNGDVYIADGYGQPWVHVYGPDAAYKFSFGGPGSEPGQLNNPHGIMLDTRGSEPLILVSDRGNHRLQYFTLDGQFVRLTEGMLRLPCTTIQYQDEIYIPDLHSRMTILDKNDQLIAHVGEREEGWKIAGWPNIDHSLRQVGNFTSPHGLHVDKQGNVYMVEWISDGRITKLARVH
jgi:DNA-binding beta-propeller fold protein YncE